MVRLGKVSKKKFLFPRHGKCLLMKRLDGICGTFGLSISVEQKDFRKCFIGSQTTIYQIVSVSALLFIPHFRDFLHRIKSQKYLFNFSLKLIFCVSDQDHHQPPRSSARERSHFNIVTFSNYVMLLNCPRVVHPHPQQHAAQDRHPLAGNCCTVEFCATRCLSHLTFSFKSLSLKEH